MFANLKKKIEEGGGVSPVGTERKAGSSSVVANNALKAQSPSYVHGEGKCSVYCCFLNYFVVFCMQT